MRVTAASLSAVSQQIIVSKKRQNLQQQKNPRRVANKLLSSM